MISDRERARILRAAADEVDQIELPDGLDDASADAFDDGAAWAMDRLRELAERLDAQTPPQVTAVRVVGSRATWIEDGMRREHRFPSAEAAMTFRESLLSANRDGGAS